MQSCLTGICFCTLSSASRLAGPLGSYEQSHVKTVLAYIRCLTPCAMQKRAPTAHTVLEIVHARWGSGARLVFGYFLLVTAVIVSGQLILGGSAVINALTGTVRFSLADRAVIGYHRSILAHSACYAGMNIYAAIFIIPFTVVLYAATGNIIMRLAE